MSEINEWDVAAGNNNSAPPNGWPEQMNYSDVNNSAREGMAAHARILADNNGTLTSAGSANSYTLTPNRAISAYALGLEFKFKANHTNTGAATLNISALGAKDLKWEGGAALTSGDVVLDRYYKVFYQGVYFVLSPYITNNNQLTNGAGYVTSSGNTVIGTDSDLNTSGAEVVDQLNMTKGVIQSHSKRTLTLSDLGYTGATNANYITDNSQLANGAGYVTSSGNTVIGTDLDIDTSGAIVVDQLNLTDGIITSHSTRTMTLADLGYTGATNANYITNNNQLTNGAGYVTSSGNTVIGTDSDINTSGATIIDSLTMTDGVITAHGTRVLTLADLGYTGATNANYITNNNQLTNGAGYVTSSGWTSANDGSGSGLDADLLDGLESNDILTMRQNLKNAHYTLALSDIGKTLYKTDNFARTWTIPPNSSVAFPIGTAITMIHDHNGGVMVTIARGSGVSLILAGDGADQDCSLAGYGVATIIKVETDKWYCSGIGVS